MNSEVQQTKALSVSQLHRVGSLFIDPVWVINYEEIIKPKINYKGGKDLRRLFIVSFVHLLKSATGVKRDE